MTLAHKFACLTPLWLILTGAAGEPDYPAYRADGALVPPADYRDWVFLSAGIDMSYTEEANEPGHSMFDNVFVDRKSWLLFKQTGHWPNGSVFAMEVRGAATKGSINKLGHYQTEERMGMEYHVRDEAKFKGGWGFFEGNGDDPAVLLPHSVRCYACHESHGAVDTTFTQFYPTAKPIAVKAGSYRAQ